MDFTAFSQIYWYMVLGFLQIVIPFLVVYAGIIMLLGMFSSARPRARNFL